MLVDIKGQKETLNVFPREVLYVEGVSQWSAPCIGPYAQANKVGPNVAIAGRVGLIAETSKLVQSSDENRADQQFEVEFSAMMESAEGAMRCMGLQLGWLDVTHVTFFVTSRRSITLLKETWLKFFGSSLLPVVWIDEGERERQRELAPGLSASVVARIVVANALPAGAQVEVIAQHWPCGKNPFFAAKQY